MSLLVFGANAYQAGMNRISRAQTDAFNFRGGARPILDKAIGGVQMQVGQESMELWKDFRLSDRRISKGMNELAKMA